MIKVELVDHMGTDLSVSNSARVSFSKWKDELEEGDTKLINYLAKHEHTSPFRHTRITLRCEAPIWLARQLGKHQVSMDWNEVSRRYVDSGIEIFEPIYRSRPEGGIKQGSGDKHPNHEKWAAITYDTHMNLIATYEAMIADGVAPEQARGILPQNMMTTWIWSGSLLGFFHLWRLRSDSHAQVEAQQFAQQVADICEQLFPISWAALKEAK